MQLRGMVREVLPFVLAMLLGACSNSAPADTAAHGDEQGDTRPVASASKSGKQDAKNVSNDNLGSSIVKPPSPDSVLYFIYQKDGDGSTFYEVDYGSWVGYWYGYQFDFDGKRYFTGFGYKTPEKLGEEEQDTLTDPEGKVAISQATFLLETKGGKTAWSLVEMDGFVGEFGANEKPSAVDPARQPQSYQTQDGRFLLAVPTTDFSTGVKTAGFALFVFDPQEREPLRDQHWAYVGTIAAGEDNSTACDEGRVMPCVASKGVLAFKPADDGGLPTLQVALSGTTIDAPGKTRALGPADTITYDYDMGQGSYQP